MQRTRLIGYLTFCGNANKENITEEAAERSPFTLSRLNANNVSGNSSGYLEQLDLQTTLAVYWALTSPDTSCYSPASDYIRLACCESSGDAADITLLSDNPFKPCLSLHSL